MHTICPLRIYVQCLLAQGRRAFRALSPCDVSCIQNKQLSAARNFQANQKQQKPFLSTKNRFPFGPVVICVFQISRWYETCTGKYLISAGQKNKIRAPKCPLVFPSATSCSKVFPGAMIPGADNPKRMGAPSQRSHPRPVPTIA